MVEVTTSTKTTAKPMRAKRVHICSRVITKVRDAKWGSQTKANGAVQIVLSSMRRPRKVIGRVCKQEPDSFLEADKSLALDKGSGAVAKSSAAMEETLGRSHDFCRYYVYHQHISPRVTWSSNRPFFSKKYQSALALLSTLEEIGSIDSHIALALLRF